MATDALSERLSSKLHLQTKTVGDERIRRAKEKDEDVAIFSMFPMEGDPKFKCCLGKDCLIGDPKKADPGDDRDDRSSRICAYHTAFNFYATTAYYLAHALLFRVSQWQNNRGRN